MEGDMRITEGQTLSEDHGNYMYINEGPIFNENHQKFNITLENFIRIITMNQIPRGAQPENFP